MPKVTFAGDEDTPASDYSSGTGAALRSDKLEVTKISFKTGYGADAHTHPEEQVMYVLSGRLRVTCGHETYDVGPGEATFHPSDVIHEVRAVEDTTALSLKNQVSAEGEAAGA